jgi:dihydrofolate reductase
MKIYIAQTIDGFIAGPGGSLDHLKPFEGNDYGYDDFISTVDALVMGRNTFNAIWFTHGWPHPEHLPGVIVTSRALPDDVPEKVSARTDLSGIATDYPDAYIDGGETIRQALDADLVSEARIFTLPVLIGDGIRLFEKGVTRAQKWALEEAKSYPCGTVLHRYRIPG